METQPSRRTTAWTLVLGGGGIPGIAYLSGALSALRNEAGLDPATADVIIGTSSGAVVAALLASGCPPEDILTTACGTVDDPVQMTLDRAWETPAELARRVAGASWVLTRATVRMPWPAPPRPLRRLFRGHLARPSDERFALAVPEAWPDRAVWLTAVDLMSGRRVALGRRPADRHSLTMRRAAIAATAFAGLLAPVRDGRRTLVDGGVHSVTNLDIAARCDGDLVVCLAPMAFDPRRPPGPLAQAMRTRSNVDLLRERTALEWLGKTLLGLRPGRDELRGQSANPLRSTRPDQLYSAAYDQCRRSLATERRWSALTELAAA